MTTILKIDKERVTPSVVNGGTVGSYGFDKLAFSFSEEWKALGKRIVFDVPRSAAVSIIITDDIEEINIPAEVKNCSGDVPFTISGYREELSLYTVSGIVRMTSSGARNTRPPSVPTPSEMAQVLSYLAKFGELSDEIKANFAKSGYLFYSLDSIGLKNGESASTDEILFNAMPLKSALFARTDGLGGTISGLPEYNGTLYLLHHDAENSVSGMYICDNGNFYTYRNGEWVLVPVKGDKGNVMYATFEINIEDGMLYMTYDDEYNSAHFRINDRGEMEVII